jgi:hydrogenase maturation protease
VEREVGPGHLSIAAGRHADELGDGVSVVRTWNALEGSVEVASDPVRDGVGRLTVRIANTTPFAGGTREAALEQTLCSCHTVLRAGGGCQFVSMTDPPDALRAEAEACVNEGTWPVLVGEPGEGGVLLSSPIILEDHPRIAPESPGDLFDGGEIDQMLVLNILSLTDEEKAEMRATDPKAREILERTEALTNDELMALHGTIRELRYARP